MMNNAITQLCAYLFPNNIRFNLGTINLVTNIGWHRDYFYTIIDLENYEIEVRGWNESYHNGDKEDQIFSTHPIEGEVLTRLYKILQEEALKKSIEEDNKLAANVKEILDQQSLHRKLIAISIKEG